VPPILDGKAPNLREEMLLKYSFMPEKKIATGLLVSFYNEKA